MSFCAKCGAELSDDVVFCPKCGQSVGAGDNPYASNLQSQHVGYDAGPSTAGAMSFGQALSTCFSKYATFSGRARRAEYWYFVLFCFLVRFILGFISGYLKNDPEVAKQVAVLGGMAQLTLLIPSLAVTARRLHDRGMTGWFQLVPQLFFIVGVVMLLLSDKYMQSEMLLTGGGLLGVGVGIVTGIVLFVKLVQIGEAGENKYGSDPLLESN